MEKYERLEEKFVPNSDKMITLVRKKCKCEDNIKYSVFCRLVQNRVATLVKTVKNILVSFRHAEFELLRLLNFR